MLTKWRPGRHYGSRQCGRSGRRWAGSSGRNDATRQTAVTMPAITLREVTRDNWRTALDLAVQPELQHFVAGVVPPVAIALAKAYIRPNRQPVLPLAIYDGDTMCGFLNLTHEAVAQEHYWVQHFFIDQRYHGRGCGTAALSALVVFLATHHPICRSVSLTVHPDNHAAHASTRTSALKIPGIWWTENRSTVLPYAMSCPSLPRTF